MPIVNGKYKNPGWVNGTRPPINAQNLNDISDTLERLDQGGSSGKRTIRFVVGTSISGWTAADCDYLCDGTNDNVEIQAALDALPAAGGEIVILDGTYQISAGVKCNNKSVCITGNGAGITVLESAQSTLLNMFFLSGSQQVSGITFKASGSAKPTVFMVSDLVTVTECEFINTELSCTGSVSGNAVISRNKFTKTAAGVRSLAIGLPGECTIADNLFLSSSPSTSDNFVQVTSTRTNNGTANFRGNIVTAQSGDTVQLDCTAVTGNTFQNCAVVNAEMCGNVSGNTFINSPISAGRVSSTTDIGHNAAVTGNLLYNCHLIVAGSTTVTGNSVQGAPDVGIKVIPSAPKDYPHATPIVEGNLVMFASGSTLPGIQLANNGSAIETDHLGAMVFGNKIINTTSPIDIQSKWASCCVVNNFFNTGSITDAGTGNTVKGNGSNMGDNDPVSTLVTLTSSGWSNNTQTVTVNGVSANEAHQMITPVPVSASQTAYYAAGIRATGQAANSLTFTADTTPTADISVYVVVQGVG